MKPRLFTIAVIFILFLNISFGQDAAAIKYIKENAVPIDTNINELSDLMPLKSIFEGRRIIGMGEATHGTHEFQIEKFRMMKFLVTEMDYRLFGIEANFTECRQVNDYVLYGTGDVKQVVAGMIDWAWKTSEVVQMVEWMRNYNISKSDDHKVKFYGFDMQFDALPEKRITEKLKKFDSRYFDAHFNMLDSLHIYDMHKNIFTVYSKEKRDSVKALLDQLAKYAAAHENELLKLFTADEVEYNKRDIRLLQQCLDENDEMTGTTKSMLTARDKYMAENIEWILDHEGKNSKMLLWAHNGHISKHDFRMGWYLEKKYEDEYYAIGFDFNKGAFKAYDLKNGGIKTDFTVQNAIKGTSGQVFSDLNIPVFFIDIEKAVKTGSRAKNFFTEKISQRAIPAAFSTDQESSLYFADALFHEYDGLIFVDATTATHLAK